MLERSTAAAAAGERTSISVMRMERRSVMRLKTWAARDPPGLRLADAPAPLPAGVGMVAAGDPRVLCIGPGEWLLIGTPSGRSAPAGVLHMDGAKTEDWSLVDLSSGVCTFSIDGSASRDLLSKGSGLDFHPAEFGTRRCARTRFAQIEALIECLDDVRRFELSVARSYAAYLESWLANATEEWP
jgi:sarcosine oxidase subunit gamma